MSLTWLAAAKEWEIACDGCGLAGGRGPSEAAAALAPYGWTTVGREHYCDDCRTFEGCFHCGWSHGGNCCGMCDGEPCGGSS